MLRVKVEFNAQHSYDNYSITFEQFMNDIYLKAYRQKVQFATYQTALTQHNMFIERFRNRKLREITTRDCEMFRLVIVVQGLFFNGDIRIFFVELSNILLPHSVGVHIRFLVNKGNRCLDILSSP